MTVSQLVWKSNVAAASTANVAGTFADSNTGPGDTITSTSGSALTIDGYTVKLSDRILLKNQTSGLQNGVYQMTQAPVAGIIATTSTITQPTGGTVKNGTYFVNLVGGTGKGAIGLVQVSSNTVQYVAVAQPGLGYTAGDTLTYNANGQGFGNGGTVTVGTVTVWPETGNSGAILTFSAFTQPSSDFVTDGTYGLIPLTGGTGTGAVGTVTIAGGIVTSVVVTNFGVGYSPGDELSFTGSGAIVGLETGGAVEVATTTFTPFVLTRTSDGNFPAQVEAMSAFIDGGSTQVKTAWVQNTLTVTMDTTPLTYVEFVS